MSRKTNTSPLAVSIALVLAPLASTALAESGCPTGFVPDGNEKLTNTGFADGYAGFNSDIVFQSPINTYPSDNNGSEFDDSGIGIMDGDLPVAGVVGQIAFPGDANPGGGAAAVAAVDRWFAYNGKTLSADVTSGNPVPTKIWEQTITGLNANTDYAFTAYFSNVLAPGQQATSYVAPLVGFNVDGVQQGNSIPVCDAGGGLAGDNTCVDEATEDKWNRLGVTLNTSGTSVVLSIHDVQVENTSGNDFGMTAISFQECVAIGTPEISVAPASINYTDGSLSNGVTRTVTVTNDGTGSLQIGTIAAITGTDFSIAQDDCSGESLTAGQTCDITVTFAPATYGSKTASLIIPSNDSDEATTTVNLSGTVVEALDSDNDGIPDVDDLDDDNDGIPDVVEGSGVEDFDGDGIPNRLDLDSDNDGLPDVLEGLNTDTNNDGRVDNFVDANNDGLQDSLEDERLPSSWSAVNTDGDSSPDFLDLNSDNDDLFDSEEAGMADTNRDGIVDDLNVGTDGWDQKAVAVLGASGVLDEDGNGTPDYRQIEGEVITRIDGGLGSVGGTMLAALFGAGAIRRRRRLAVATAAMFGMAGMAQAEQGQFYVGGGLGISTLEPEVVNIPDLTVEDTNDTGMKLFLGYDILDWLSIEGFGATLGAAGLEDSNPNPADAGGEIDYNVFGAGLVANFPHNDQGLSFLGKVGLASIDNSSDNVDFREVESSEIYAGLGAEYQFENGFSLRAEYEYFDKDAQLISASLLKRFGGEVPPPPPVPAPVVKAKPKPVYVPPAPKPPAPAPVVVETIQLNINSIYFDTDKSDLKPAAIAQLDEIVQLLKTYEEVELNVVGHTDSRATDAYNQRLSEDRSNAAMAYLQSNGISAERLSVGARGESEPAADNTTKDGRALNRRVDFYPNPTEVFERQ